MKKQKQEIVLETKVPGVTLIYREPDEPSNFIQNVMYHAQIKSELPELLSKLVILGRKDEAVDLLIQWGTHTLANSEVWERAKELLKVGKKSA